MCDPVMGLVSEGYRLVICNDGHLLPKPANLSWEEAAEVEVFSRYGTE